MKIRKRITLSISSGYQTDELSLAFIKLGLATYSFQSKMDVWQTAIAGGPKKLSPTIGIGYKRFIESGMNWYGIAEYSKSVANGGRMTATENMSYFDTGRLTASTLSVGLGYAF